MNDSVNKHDSGFDILLCTDKSQDIYGLLCLIFTLAVSWVYYVFV